MKTFGIAALAGLALSASALAGDLKPIAAESIALGGVVGTAYYTVEPDGFRVVATLASGEDATPVRFTATLQPGQRTTISVPRASGEGPLEVEFARQGDTLRVTRDQKLSSLY